MSVARLLSCKVSISRYNVDLVYNLVRTGFVRVWGNNYILTYVSNKNAHLPASKRNAANGLPVYKKQVVLSLILCIVYRKPLVQYVPNLSGVWYHNLQPDTLDKAILLHTIGE